jgi:ribonucleoside-diphosphate reductase alpha chain
VEDHAWRLYQRLKGSAAAPTEAFVTAMELSPQGHVAMLAAVAPYIDAGISKTVNAPAACSYAEFEALYRLAWRGGLKGLTAFRPSRVLGSVLQLPSAVASPLRA